MKNLQEYRTIAEIDWLIKEIDRNDGHLEERARDATPAERLADPHLNAMCNALEHRAKLEAAA
ncbi:MAG: hypothetical protein Q7R90_00575 [bacterium]|nr:hypothetical protein [bacterium]